MRNTSKNFYRDLQGYKDLKDIFKHTHFTSVPNDWCVLFVDIVQSTKAVLNGRYKDVHNVSAHLMASMLSTGPDYYKDIPYYFGGDGIVMLLPYSLKATALDHLKTAQNKSAERGLSIRGCVIGISDIHSYGYQIRIAKHQVSNEYSQAIFEGEGLEFVEKLCRAEHLHNNKRISRAIEPMQPQVSYDTHLEVWKYLQPTKELFVSLIIKAHCLADYADIIDSIERICGNNILKEICDYTKHSDYIKFDGSLKTVIQGTSVQVESLLNYLKDMHNKGGIYYGAHISEQSVVTSVINPKDKQHVYLIDGSGSGYTKASIGFKKQLYKV